MRQKVGWHHSEEAKEKIRASKIGSKNPMFGQRLTGSKNGMFGKNHSPEWKAERKGMYSGSSNPNWRGGKSRGREHRGHPEYKLWRKAVFIRDNFTCQKYGTKGGELVAHHINNFKDFPEFRFAIDNGITLSVKAHNDFHRIYGKNNNTREQLEEFLCA